MTNREDIMRIYWDACAWIAFFRKEGNVGSESEDWYQMCSDVLDVAQQHLFELCTSAFTFIEVYKRGSGEVTEGNLRKLDEFFVERNVFIMPLNRKCGIATQRLIQDPNISVGRMDAIHLAAAQLANASMFHTFDNKLIKLSGKLLNQNGDPIHISRPAVP